MLEIVDDAHRHTLGGLEREGEEGEKMREREREKR